MFQVTSSLCGGLAAVMAWAPVAQPFDTAKANIGSDRKVVTVEVVGVQDAAIVYRDRDGRVLFQTDPLANVTVISKGFVLPQVTVREMPRSTPAPILIPHNLEAAPAIPIGCDPV